MSACIVFFTSVFFSKKVCSQSYKSVKCQNNKCVDARFTSLITDEEEEEIENVFNIYLNAGENCDIGLANSVITEKSKEIVRYTCSNMANEVKCYTGRNFEILAKQDIAVLYLIPFSYQIENPIFFIKENGEWKIDLYKMSNGLAMGGSSCDTGWGWRNDEIAEEFCGYFKEGECPER